MISFGVFLKLIYKLLKFFHLFLTSLHTGHYTLVLYAARKMNIFRNNCHYIFIGFYKFHSPATWLNLFMQSQGINEKIQKQLGQLLKNFHATRRDICIFVMYHKCQVHITTRLFTLWSAFRCVPVVYLQLQSVLFLFIIALTHWSSTTKNQLEK